MPERKQFIAFLADLIESHVIGFPAYLLSGDVPSVYTIGTAMIPYQRSDGPEPASLKGNGFDLTVRYSGSDPGALLAAARLAPLGSEDICVYFISRYYPPSPGLTPQEMIGCDAGVFATRTPRAMVHDEPFFLSENGGLFSYDPDDPESVAPLKAVRAYPTDPAHPQTVHHARWFLHLEGKPAWELMAPALPVCARHFGGDHFAGSHSS